ncbi:hypothetical protein MUP79_02225 [Candidatus Bathyarchaeota archaeon]|nr:hypothetical protein [Candidatus Bathyarchaeota archaeon]
MNETCRKSERTVTEPLSISSNVYAANLLFDKEIPGFDFFRIEGITSERD